MVGQGRIPRSTSAKLDLPSEGRLILGLGRATKTPLGEAEFSTCSVSLWRRQNEKCGPLLKGTICPIWHHGTAAEHLFRQRGNVHYLVQ